jgi:ATP-dependent Lon protease
VPWSKKSEERLDLKVAPDLDADHAGLDVKERTSSTRRAQAA